MKWKNEKQGWRRQGGIYLYYLCWLLKIALMWCFAVARRDIAWDYDSSSEGWVAREDTSMHWISGSGLIIGSTTGLNPHIDSPTFSLLAGYQERTVAALRLRYVCTPIVPDELFFSVPYLKYYFLINNIQIRYLGRSRQGRLDIRIGGHPGLEIGAPQMAWGMQLDKVPLAPKVVDSSNTLGMVSGWVHVFGL